MTKDEDFAHKLALLHSSAPLHWLSPLLWRRGLEHLRVSSSYLTCASKLQSRFRTVALLDLSKRVPALLKLLQESRTCLVTLHCEFINILYPNSQAALRAHRSCLRTELPLRFTLWNDLFDGRPFLSRILMLCHVPLKILRCDSSSYFPSSPQKTLL